ncbi:CHAT domain-containing protein [Thelonectria olida]|uniref:CHAT domain-containing protein n=1 Tax=Thelonectria olida TaxID=1576542 RepID=A0A9P8VWG1_9HYPO|nr:CHAT domain-containing protein [Thelonectria olida]
MDLQQTFQQLGIDVEDMPSVLSGLAIEAYEKFQETGDVSDIHLAVEAAQLDLMIIPDTSPHLTSCLNNLGVFLESRYEQTGEMTDLEEAIGISRQAVDLTPDDHPDRASWLNNLGTKLTLRLTRQAVNSTPDDHPDKAGWLNNLGISLERQYERTGEMAELEEAIGIARQAVDSTPDDHPDRAACLSSLGNQLGRRYKRTGKVANLEEAISIARQVVNLTPDDHPGRTDWLDNLGVLLESRYERRGEMVDLEEAIGIARQAVDSILDDYPDRAGWLGNLGTKLGHRYERTGEMADLEEAISLVRQAVNSTPDDHPDQARWLTNLGVLLESRHERTGEMADLEEASLTLQDAWHCQSAIPFHRVQAGARCLKLLAPQHKTDIAIDLGKNIIDLLPSVNTKLLDRSDQQFVVSTFSGVAADLCAFLLQSNQTAEALRYLEKGRAVIIGQLMDSRSDLSLLEQQHPDIARRYQQLRDEVNIPLRQVEQGIIQAQLRIRRLEALAELDACIHEIRGIAGHERFMLGQETAEMQECAAGGSIIVNITTLRSDAIIVSPTTIKTLNLPMMAAEDARAWLDKKWTGRRSERAQKNREYLDYLSWLWKTCVKQILDEVCHSHDTANRLPRIWWIGTGLASSMPFHAAGIHSADSTENAFSRVVSSYTPSIKALAHAQHRARAAESDKGSVLIATMPTTPGNSLCPDLPGVEEEKNQLMGVVNGHLPIQYQELPSVEDVVESLRNCYIAHFACHGFTDHLDPSKSGLILQSRGEQDRLTVHTVSELSLSNAQIAYLSACSTAENGAARLSDEVIHRVSGFQIAGFPHVIGCLWPSIDRVCVEVAGRFYRSLLRGKTTCWDGREVALALRDAVMEVRKTELKMPLAWAQFVHFELSATPAPVAVSTPGTASQHVKRRDVGLRAKIRYMSGAEIIGLISGIIGILDGTPSISAVFRTEHKEEGRLKEEEHLVQTP